MLDITNICRICLKEEDPKLPIFTENDEKSESKPTLPEKIMSFARVKVVKDDGLPMYICVKCYCQVDTTVEFKKLCEESFHFFTRQLDAFSNSKTFFNHGPEEKERSDVYESNSRALPRANNVASVHPSLKETVSFTQHCIIPEDSIKAEGSEEECDAEEEPITQVFRITGNDESWVHNGETDFDTAIIKCEPTWDYPSYEFDLSNVKIEGGGDNWLDEERVNPLELNPGDYQDPKSPCFDALASTTGMEKTRKCRSCEMVFSNRREMGFHISFAHRRCGTCRKYFFSNKDKDGHICSGSKPGEKSVPRGRIDKAGQCCHLCNKTVKQIKSHLAWHKRRKVPAARKETEPEEKAAASSRDAEPDNSSTDEKISCALCNVVCSTEKGFKVHLRCMHTDHRLIYSCVVCKSLQFFSKASCTKHLFKKHGVVANGNISFELRHVADCDMNVRGMLKRKMKRKSYMKVGKEKMKLGGESRERSKENEASPGGKKSFPPAKTRRRRGRMSPRPSHPPFSPLVPIISNNFNVTLDNDGVKRYTCRGCNVMYKRYMAAYNHYYSHNKRIAAKAEQSQSGIDGKPYNCKFCTLKFASRSQAMMHRIHAHKYFYKKFPVDKK